MHAGPRHGERQTAVELIAKADIVSPWTVGRYGSPKEAANYAAKTLTPDIAWCREKSIEKLNTCRWFSRLQSGIIKTLRFPTNHIPASGRRIPLVAIRSSQESRARRWCIKPCSTKSTKGPLIYKCTNDVPIGDSTFLTYEGLPSDHYLKLVGAATKMIRGEIPPTDAMPRIEPEAK